MSVIRLLLLVLLIAAGGKVAALTLYVSPAGHDRNAGTRDQPLASLKGAQHKVRQWRKQNHRPEAVEIRILEGDYFMQEPLTLLPEDGGTPGAPVTYKAAQGATPVFYGGIQVKNFEKVNDKLWKAYLPEVARYNWTFEQLYVNGQRATRARYPNEEFYRPRAVTETTIAKSQALTAEVAVQKISLFPEQAAIFQKLSEQELANTVVTFYHKWDNTRKKVLRYSAGDTAIYLVGRGMKPWNKLNEKTLYTIENLPTALDAPGEWFLEPGGHLYYVPLAQEKIESLACYAPVNEQFLVIAGSREAYVENLHFEGISFQVAAYQMPATGNEPMQAAALVEATIQVDYAKNIRFINCEVAHTGSNAIWFRKACSDSQVEHCYLHDLGAGAVKIGEVKPSEGPLTRNITVDNNIVRSGGHVFPCAVALAIFNASDNALTHNEIADFRYSGISAGWVWGYGHSPSKRNKIDFNHIHHLGWGVLSDMGGVYTLGPSQGTSVSNNVIHHVYSDTYGGWGLYTDEGSTGITMENNLVYACKSSGFHQHYGKDNIIRNNIFANQIRAQLEATKIEAHNSFTFTNNIIYYSTGKLSGIRWEQVNFVSDRNAYWDTRSKDILVGDIPFRQWRKAGRDTHSVIADPGFRDPENYDFRLANRSLAARIKFKPFDYTKAGVYGDPAWKELAAFDPAVARKFDQTVARHEQKTINQ